MDKTYTDSRASLREMDVAQLTTGAYPLPTPFSQLSELLIFLELVGFGEEDKQKKKYSNFFWRTRSQLTMMFKLSPGNIKLSLTKLWIPGLVSELPYRFATVLTRQLTVMKQRNLIQVRFFWTSLINCFIVLPSNMDV